MGGGRTASTSSASTALPYTGVETWLVTLFGSALLALGIVLHVTSARIAMTAMLYKRGILLRPTDCCRVARRRGLPRLHAAVSTTLGRLLEEPAGAEFTSLRPLASRV